MDRKTKVVVVAGMLDDVRVLDLFEALPADYEVTVCAIQTENLLNHYRSPLLVKVFQDIPDMPGYMRGIEDELQGADVIIGLESARLSTFQAVRSALKFKKPVLVLTTETTPISFHGYANIRAIQSDILENATHFLPASQAAWASLQLENVSAERMTLLPLAVDSRKFERSETLRARFRQYIGVAKNEHLVLFKEPLTADNRPVELLHMMKLLKATNPVLYSRMRVLFAGDGPIAQELKYRSYDYGLGKQAMFLHQNCEPFIRDLYCATDVVVSLRRIAGDRHPDLAPRYLLEAAATGAVPMVTAGSVGHELLGDAAIGLNHDHFHGLCEQMTALLTDASALAGHSERCMSRIRETFDVMSAANILVDVIQRVANQHAKNLEGQSYDLQELYERIDTAVGLGRHEEVLVFTEDLLLRLNDRPAKRSEALCTKAESLCALGRLEEATSSFSDAVMLFDGNWRAYLGLGHLALRSQASDEAMAFYKKALAKQPNNAKAMLGIGLVQKRAGMIEESIYWLKCSLICDRSDTSTISALAQACLESQHLDAAISVLESVVDLVGERASVVLALGQLYMKDGQVEHGKELMAKALANPPAA